MSIRDNDLPEGCRVLHKLHLDIRELKEQDVALFSNPHKINKQHIFPSPNNVSLLKDIKKVVLLREPEEIINAYRRGAIKKVHSLLPGYDKELSEEQWLTKAKQDGLFDDLIYFESQWKKEANPDNTLFVQYSDYLKNPSKVINEIEALYDLPLTKDEIVPAKARYTRRSPLEDVVFLFKKTVVHRITWILKKTGLKDILKPFIKSYVKKAKTTV